MKNQLVFLIIFFSITANATDTLTIYYNKDWKKIRNASDASFFRKTYKKDRKMWVAKDYFSDGRLQMEGCFTSKKGKVRTGKFRYFYENGQLKSVGVFKNDNKEGEWNFYNKNGGVEQSSNYKDGWLHGESIYYFESGELFGKIMYDEGEDTKVQYWSKDGVEQEEDLAIEVNPEFPGGNKAMALFIRDEFKYPEEARMNGQKGTVYVEMVVTKYGFIENVKVVRGVSPSLNAECLRVVKAMPNWKPGKQMNKPVNVRYTIPIKCRLG